MFKDDDKHVIFFFSSWISWNPKYLKIYINLIWNKLVRTF